MDDLLGEDWAAPPKTSPSPIKLVPPSITQSIPSRPTSAVGSSRASSTVQPSRPSSIVNGGTDSFGALFAPKTQKSGNLTIQERQKQLAEEKRRQQESNAKLWDDLGSRKSTSAIQQQEESEDDILAAFNKAAPVDASSHFPPEPIDDDDPFGLGPAPKKVQGKETMQSDVDDILGDLARPVELSSKSRQEADAIFEQMQSRNDKKPAEESKNDRGLAELVEMGFPADKARLALAESGGDVQGAVGWLLQQAHDDSRAKSHQKVKSARRQDDIDNANVPAWMRSRTSSGSRSRDSHANGQKDAAAVAQDLGNKLFKSANSFWKASQKQVAKTLSELQERDSSQPKWMQGSAMQAPAKKGPPVTDEAAMLDMPRTHSERPRSAASKLKASVEEEVYISPARRKPRREPEVPKVSEEVYISPARRKPQPKAVKSLEPEMDLFNAEPPTRTSVKSTPQPAQPPAEPEINLLTPEPATSPPSKAPTLTKPPTKPTISRTIPPCPASSLSESSSHRQAGSEAFKLGDFTTAQHAYTLALQHLPDTHPLRIIILTNRSLTALKTGDTKSALSDAEAALFLIGPSKGQGESIDLDGTAKHMREYYTKALLRKAEALENLEKYADAGRIYKQAVEEGVGGLTAKRGRERCEGVAGSSKPRVVPRVRETPKGKEASRAKVTSRAKVGVSTESEAVSSLRAARLEAERTSAESFALSEKVDGKIAAWTSGGKGKNLRALLASLEMILWEEAGWKKVNMGELLMPGRVKVVYMKAIAKVHPDKIALDATTEQKMIGSAVFTILNEAWDGFRKENNL
ncbi:hypothetical protein K470DRAFT_220952 [Piedraia hortae CBS 480.64]|uniref:UBA domain-containing protein n=1 Tax=Piedraia hortae CBS 480.64 TaxID=1314780 RepID=A0A6A7BTH6_9PEZI|nr:hypothetical protein K470DRAFT_220952 [Piedraia hortae CBS 480.64]